MTIPVPAARRLVHPLPVGAVRWTGGFWGERFELCRRVVLPHMRQSLEHPDNSARLANFRVAAGLETGGHRGTFWSDGDCYKYLEALAHVHAVTGDAALDREMDEIIDWISGAQDDDGYLNTQIQLNPAKRRWESVNHHELYNLGHLFTAAAAHREATGKTSLLAVAKRAANYLYGVFQPRPPELAFFGFNPSNIMGLIDLYRVTGDIHDLELAGIFVDMRGSRPGGGYQNQNNRPLREESEAWGHAVTATYLWAGATDVYSHTGDETLLAALRRVWRNVVERRMYVTGAVGAHHFTAYNGREAVHEAFGRDFILPQATAYNETCANLGHAMWNKRLLEVTGDARFADIMELVLYNSGLSGMSLDGTRFQYTNPLRWYGTDHPLLNNDTPGRWVIHKCYCCPPQIARTLASLHRWAYGRDEEGLWVHLYGASEATLDLPGGPLTVRQTTAYPWAGQVDLIILAAPATEATIRLRIPGWAAGATVDGRPVEPGYHPLRRVWRAGETVRLDLPLAPRLVTADPRVEECCNQAAVLAGPVVYCLEGVDLPGEDLLAAHLLRDGELSLQPAPDLLGGVAQVTAAGWLADPAPGELYRPASRTGHRRALTLIPYYAYGNRGPSPMSVWLPLV